MHPLERQVQDLKETLEKKDQRLKKIEAQLTSMPSQLEVIKAMLHPSRQKHIDVLVKQVDASLGV